MLVLERLRQPRRDAELHIGRSVVNDMTERAEHRDYSAGDPPWLGTLSFECGQQIK